MNFFQCMFEFRPGAVVERGYRHARPNPNLRFSVDAGAASNFLTEYIHPSLNVEFQLYNGGLGSRNDDVFFQSRFCLDVITALTATAGIKNKFKAGLTSNLLSRNVPLYYFGSFVQPALQNPFDYSFSIGTNLIFSTDRQKTSQRVGFFDLHAGSMQLSYFNDGGWPFSNIYLGDRKDRYYTGGITISYNGRRHSFPETVEVAYYKYTGYSKSAFEVSNKLNLAYVYYHKAVQQNYNRSLVMLNMGNPSRGYGISFRSYNYVDQDVQHWIHWGLSNAYHIVSYKPYLAVSGSYYGYNTKIGLR